MAVESAADRATFLDTDEFGVAGSYVSAANTATVNGILDEAFLNVEVNAGAPIASRAYLFECRSADLPSDAAQDDTITISSVVYVVTEIQPDLSGDMTTLILDKP